MCIEHLHLEVWFLASGFWLLDSGFWILASGFWILDSGFWILDSGSWQLHANACSPVISRPTTSVLISFVPS
ncbi:MAG: hypothetical protein CUN48_04220 [Candidatus Thermofonsia Clade 3 bacterium]|uniref:Phosphotransferase n=1 Tax=Candidatus Thermofonsia Clade 3 bacterium TaxID=2364212 RepID=A0A2M8QER6_9CHLR|nr:MAG: hypothetical protein CUN48_04220 [Candidatus Thermofonsia Clade 3 bacterium]